MQFRARVLCACVMFVCGSRTFISSIFQRGPSMASSPTPPSSTSTARPSPASCGDAPALPTTAHARARTHSTQRTHILHPLLALVLRCCLLSFYVWRRMAAATRTRPLASPALGPSSRATPHSSSRSQCPHPNACAADSHTPPYLGCAAVPRPG